MEEAPREKRTRPRGPRERPERPRGRGLGAPTKTVFKCNRCGQSLGLSVAFDATCEGCGNDLHTCTNCAHFDTSAPNQCREPVVERIAKKAHRNRCELFAPKTTKEFDSDKPSPDDARAAFDSLFDL